MEALWATIVVTACYWLPIAIVLISFIGLVFRRRRSRQEHEHRTSGAPGGMVSRRAALPNLIASVPAAAAGDWIDWAMDVVWPDKRPSCPNCAAKLDSYVATLGKDKGEKKYLCRNCGFEEMEETISLGA